MNKIILGQSILFGISLIYAIFPPKVKNYFWGYRTFNSMKNDSSFHYANKLASKYFLVISILCLTLSLLLNHYNENVKIATFVFLILSIITFIIVERKLVIYNLSNENSR
jgi:uncharacterized membrane protein